MGGSDELVSLKFNRKNLLWLLNFLNTSNVKADGVPMEFILKADEDGAFVLAMREKQPAEVE